MEQNTSTSYTLELRDGANGEAKRRERSEKLSAFGSTPDRLMLRRCTQRSETMVPVNNRSWPSSFSSLSLSWPQCPTKGLLGGSQGRWVERAAWHFNGGGESDREDVVGLDGGRSREDPPPLTYTHMNTHTGTHRSM